jgi:hypothetical protein
MQKRGMSLRNAAVAAILVATVGIWTVAMWAWLGPGSSKAPISAPTAVGTRIPEVSGLMDGVGHAPPTPQPPPARTATTTDWDAQALPGSKPLPVSIPALPARQSSPPAGMAADNRAQAFGRTTLPDTGTAVVRGIQTSLPSEVTSDGNPAVVRGKQAPSAAQTPPDSGPAVVRGNRAPSASFTP